MTHPTIVYEKNIQLVVILNLTKSTNSSHLRQIRSVLVPSNSRESGVQNLRKLMISIIYYRYKNYIRKIIGQNCPKKIANGPKNSRFEFSFKFTRIINEK